jgi:SAM-dependent methyltransferase
MISSKQITHLPYAIDEATDRNHFFENHWKRVALALLERHAGDLSNMTILDFGCGRGETMQYAAERGMVPTGFDTDPHCVALASRFGRTETLDLTRVPEQAGEKSFDVVACFHVLEHVENPKETLTLLGRAARQYVLVAVPNLQKIPNLRKPWATPLKTNEGHLQSWDHAHFQNLAETHCGLQLIAWANDATIVPIASEFIRRLFGNRFVLSLETGLFCRLFPYWGISIIALLRPPSLNEQADIQ